MNHRGTNIYVSEMGCSEQNRGVPHHAGFVPWKNRTSCSSHHFCTYHFLSHLCDASSSSIDLNHHHHVEHRSYLPSTQPRRNACRLFYVPSKPMELGLELHPKQSFDSRHKHDHGQSHLHDDSSSSHYEQGRHCGKNARHSRDSRHCSQGSFHQEWLWIFAIARDCPEKHQDGFSDERTVDQRAGECQQGGTYRTRWRWEEDTTPHHLYRYVRGRIQDLDV
jgi:hypothetical protein